MTDKLVSDFQEQDPANVPVFLYRLGDVVYSFGEAKYYSPRPIVAIAGNDDGMVAPGDSTSTLQAFLNNFCATDFHQSPDPAGWIEPR